MLRTVRSPGWAASVSGIVVGSSGPGACTGSVVEPAGNIWTSRVL